MDKVGVYNPTDSDFSCTYDVDGKHNPVTFTVPAGEIEYFDAPLARHVQKHLADTILGNRGAGSRAASMVRDEIMQEISVDDNKRPIDADI